MPNEQPFTVILVTQNGMGHAATELQHTLAAKYFQLLLADGKRPGAICFYAEGVRLVCEGSPALDALRAFEEQGVPLIVCNTCLNFLGLSDKHCVGLVGGMNDIIEAQWKANKVITI
jgi:hypothetical protein